MATPKEILWDPAPHTRAKLQVLGGYLDAWFPILSSRFGSITYVDGFAGPGEYIDRTAGSPLIALRAAMRAAESQRGTAIHLVLVERNPERFRYLSALVKRNQTGLANLAVELINGSCETSVLPALNRLGAWDGPIFANLDGWGVDSPFSIIERLGRSRSTEVLVTLEAQWFTRFAGSKDPVAGDRVFGNPEWREVASKPSRGKETFLVDLYLERLGHAGFSYNHAFKLAGPRERPVSGLRYCGETRGGTHEGGDVARRSRFGSAVRRP